MSKMNILLAVMAITAVAPVATIGGAAEAGTFTSQWYTPKPVIKKVPPKVVAPATTTGPLAGRPPAKPVIVAPPANNGPLARKPDAGNANGGVVIGRPRSYRPGGA